MSDVATVAKRDEDGYGPWDECKACGARHRLDGGLCRECASDPIKVELVELRTKTRVLEDANLRQLAQMKSMRSEVRPLLVLAHAARVLPLLEDEYLLLVSIMLDVVEDDKTFGTLALNRKLRALEPNKIPEDI